MNARIAIDPAVCHGKPVIRKTRVLVANILADLAAGQTHERIIENYPNVTEDDIKAALEFGSELANFETLPLEAGSQ
ncbi:MAG: DUF433 domain-containing protein [Chitinivibrionales bacterium]|nr:DUF433 domain-containing protein [Chitinivibrionales bacterium]MBD3396871.1 DUF433 domain-containing protein [Chitinivibrionales bacterium]